MVFIQICIYVAIIGVVVADVVAANIINKKRRALNLNDPEEAKREKGLKLALILILSQSFIVAVFLLLYVKPMLLASVPTSS